MLHISRKSIYLTLLVITFPISAHAYIDPGSGHLGLQLILAFGAGVLFYMKSLWQYFRPGKKSKTAPSTESAKPGMDRPTLTSKKRSRSAKSSRRKAS